MSATILEFSVQYSVYTGYMIVISGLIGNVLNILVFTQLKLFRNNRSAFYLTVESISSVFNQLLNITVIILTIVYGDDATGRNLI